MSKLRVHIFSISIDGFGAGGFGMVPSALVVDDRFPRLQTHANEHQEIEHSQEVNVYRAQSN